MLADNMSVRNFIRRRQKLLLVALAGNEFEENGITHIEHSHGDCY